jgi:prepilin-type N-terminal cleavage/methylation domain-containing protein
MIVRRALTAQGGKMKRKFKFAGFTLLELIIVIIILGVLAILGFTQYGRMVERSRGAEAKSILGDLRKLAYAFYLENGYSLTGPPVITPGNLNLAVGGNPNAIPMDCVQTSHYFGYTFVPDNANQITFTATRCGAGTGKNPGIPPGAIAAQTLTLQSVLNTGVDTWGGTGGY